MDYKVYEYDNYNIYTINTNKFKSIIVSLTLINDFKEENLTKSALLRKLLTSSSKELKNEIEVSKKVKDLYNSGIGISNELYNKSLLTIFDIEFLEDKYTEDGLSEKALDYFFSSIFNPNIIDDKFEEENFKLAKKALQIYYDREKERKNGYALNKAYELLDEPHLRCKINGDSKTLNKITSADMVNYYNEIFKTGCAGLFVIGNINDDIIDIINEKVKGKLNKNDNNFTFNEFKDIPKIKEKIDKENNNQSKIVMIYKILNMTDRERNVVLPVFNRIFGVGNNSRLFKVVREENSLCYDIRSISQREESIITVIAGINKESKDKVIDLTNEELSKIQNGDFSDDLLEESKKFRLRILKSFEDEIGSILGIRLGNVLFKNDNLDDRIKMVDTVTKNEIITFANKLKLNVIYMLEGDKSEED